MAIELNFPENVTSMTLKIKEVEVRIDRKAEDKYTIDISGNAKEIFSPHKVPLGYKPNSENILTYSHTDNGSYWSKSLFYARDHDGVINKNDTFTLEQIKIILEAIENGLNKLEELAKPKLLPHEYKSENGDFKVNLIPVGDKYRIGVYVNPYIPFINNNFVTCNVEYLSSDHVNYDIIFRRSMNPNYTWRLDVPDDYADLLLQFNDSDIREQKQAERMFAYIVAYFKQYEKDHPKTEITQIGKIKITTTSIPFSTDVKMTVEGMRNAWKMCEAYATSMHCSYMPDENEIYITSDYKCEEFVTISGCNQHSCGAIQLCKPMTREAANTIISWIHKCVDNYKKITSTETIKHGNVTITKTKIDSHTVSLSIDGLILCGAYPNSIAHDNTAYSFDCDNTYTLYDDEDTNVYVNNDWSYPLKDFKVSNEDADKIINIIQKSEEKLAKYYAEKNKIKVGDNVIYKASVNVPSSIRQYFDNGYGKVIDIEDDIAVVKFSQKSICDENRIVELSIEHLTKDIKF